MWIVKNKKNGKRVFHSQQFPLSNRFGPMSLFFII